MEYIGHISEKGTFDKGFATIGVLRIGKRLSERIPNMTIQSSENRYGRLFITIGQKDKDGCVKLITNKSGTRVYDVQFGFGMTSKGAAAMMRCLADVFDPTPTDRPEPGEDEA